MSMQTITSAETAERGDVLVGPDWLERHRGEVAVTIIEVDVSRAAYDAGHIEGALLWNAYADLKDGNYRLVEKQAVQELLERCGIGPESTVVFYGYAPALAFWLLTLYRHRDVRILDCPRGAWKDEGRPWTTVVPTPLRSRYRLPDPDGRIRATQRDVLDAVGDPSTRILDVRTDLEYRGERFWPSGAPEPDGRAGHIPSAINIGLDALYGADGRFRGAAELEHVFEPAALSEGAAAITYCTIGGRASTAWFALTYLMHRPGVRVYDGSWAEWGRMSTTPIA